MPLGIEQNNHLLSLTLDVWQDQIFFNDSAFPAGYFAADILNVSDETMRELLTHGGEISFQVEALANAGHEEFIKLLPETRTSMEKLLDALWKCPPYNLLDQGKELHALDVLFDPGLVDELLKPESPVRQFFFRYLTAGFSIPLGIFHFAAAGWYFEAGYLHRLKKRTETHFAIATHDCFTSEDFWTDMRGLPMADIEAFTIFPAIASSYVFAQSPRNEEEMVFVQRINFPTPMQFYCFDLLNGMHHVHAPSRCQNCGRYFLTTSGHQPKYCDGIAPQDSRMTCRQYGAMQHQKEQNKQHPVYRIFSTRTNTIRKHHQRGKISDELRQAALKLAEEYRDKALLDNDYAEHGYALDMEQEHLYGETRKRVREKEGG